MADHLDTEAIAARAEKARKFSSIPWAKLYAADAATLLAALGRAEAERDELKYQLHHTSEALADAQWEITWNTPM